MILGLLQVVGFGLVVVAFAVLFVFFLSGSPVRVVNEYERGVVFSFGRLRGRRRGRGSFSSSRYATG